ncbi:MAG: hypothetical protein ACFFCS_03945, partial [Candidatus Hodarchaeota archaeon]
AYIGDDGKLEYKPYANIGEENKVNIIPDFSHAGYMRGGVPLPEIPVNRTLDPIAGDNLARIQEAINNVSDLPEDASGFRGAVLLTRGLYEINGTLIINQSGVVLRGEGQGMDGTILKSTSTSKGDFIKIQGSGSGLPEILSFKRNITSPYVPTGAKTFEIENTSGYVIGDEIVVVRTPNQDWIDSIELGMEDWDLGGDDVPWTPASYTISHERVIKASNNDTMITIDIPIVDPMQDKYGSGYVCKTNVMGRINNSGVENLRLESCYAHDEDENHAWNAIALYRAKNCWVKQVTAQYFAYSCVNIQAESNFNTIQDCAMLDPKSITTGGRKYSFCLGNGLGNLFQRCYTRGGRHDYVTHARLTGPNVFLDCLSEETYADIGPHHRWATGTLFDNVKGGEIRVRNRGSSGSGHGWAGAQTMFWHCTTLTHDIWVDSPKGAMNWGIACFAYEANGDGYWELWGNDVVPRSLYLQQLQDRLGKDAVLNVTVSQQLDGTLWNEISRWAGEGEPTYL